jgi:hypothetical protein
MRFALGTMYLHLGTSQRFSHVFSQSLVPYATIVPNLHSDIETSIRLCVDFNVDITRNKATLDYVKENFTVDCVAE